MNVLENIKHYRALSNHDIAKTLGITRQMVSTYTKFPEKLTLEKINKLFKRYSFSETEKLMVFANDKYLKTLIEEDLKNEFCKNFKKTN